MPRTILRLLLPAVRLLLLAGCLSSTQTRDRDDIRTRLDQATGDTVFIYQSNIGLEEPGLSWSRGGSGYKVTANGKTAGLIGDQTVLSFAIPRGRGVVGVNVFDTLLQRPITYAIDNKGQGPYFLRIVTKSNLLMKEAIMVPVSRGDFEAAATRPIRY